MIYGTALEGNSRAPRLSAGTAWLSLLLQVALVASVEVGDDLLRGLVAEHDTRTGIDNALRVVRFEADHHFWIEPGWQLFFQQTHQILGITLGWTQSQWLFNTMYTLGHVFITLLFALWMFFWRPALFPFVRNIFIGANALALVGYEAYPMAPPRLTTGLIYDGHHFRFVDTLYQVLGANGKILGSQVGYNEFAAMPSVHMAWALIVGITLFWTLRHPLTRALALCYPAFMLATVVVTGNHYIADAIGAVFVLTLATTLAIGVEWLKRRELSLGEVLRRLAAQRSPAAHGQAGDAPWPAVRRTWERFPVRRPLAGAAAWPARWAVHLHIGLHIVRHHHHPRASAWRWRDGRRAAQHSLMLGAGHVRRAAGARARHTMAHTGKLGGAASAGLRRAGARTGIIAELGDDAAIAGQSLIA